MWKGPVPSLLALTKRKLLMASWLIARVVSNVENTVCERLSRLGTESYWPRFVDTIIDKRTHRKRKIIKPLFPCYIFVRSKFFYFLFDVDGVTGVVMCGEGPATSTRLDNQIVKLRKSEQDGFVPAPVVEPKISVGSEVVILSGVLQGRLGKCEEVQGTRAKIVTMFFGRETPVWHSDSNLASTGASYLNSNNARRRIDQLQLAS